MLNTKTSSLFPIQPKKRIHLGILLLLVIVLGLGSRRLGSHLPEFIAINAGDVLWTIAVYLTLSIVCPRSQPWKLALASYAISVAVEFSQLIDADWLNKLRMTMIGKLLVGVGFIQEDLYRYLTGALIAFAVDHITRRLSTKNPTLPTT